MIGEKGGTKWLENLKMFKCSKKLTSRFEINQKIWHENLKLMKKIWHDKNLKLIQKFVMII